MIYKVLSYALSEYIKFYIRPYSSSEDTRRINPSIFTLDNATLQSQIYTKVCLILPPEYEIERALPNMQSAYAHSFCKHHLFGNTWGDAIVNPACYTDTWFSVVTETIFDYPHSFRTEKIWKPILMAHPFVAAANRGYLRDLRNAGFRTFHNYINESYDQIDCPSKRIDSIIATIGEICQNGAAEFWTATQDICKYNQQHLVEHNQLERAQLPINLEKYLDERS